MTKVKVFMILGSIDLDFEETKQRKTYLKVSFTVCLPMMWWNWCHAVTSHMTVPSSKSMTSVKYEKKPMPQDKKVWMFCVRIEMFRSRSLVSSVLWKSSYFYSHLRFEAEGKQLHNKMNYQKTCRTSTGGLGGVLNFRDIAISRRADAVG